MSAQKFSDYKFNYEQLVQAMQLYRVIKRQQQQQKNFFFIESNPKLYMELTKNLGIENAQIAENLEVPVHVVERMLELLTAPDFSAEPWAENFQKIVIGHAKDRLPPKESVVEIKYKQDSLDASYASVVAVLKTQGLEKLVKKDGAKLMADAEAFLFLSLLKSRHLEQHEFKKMPNYHMVIEAIKKETPQVVETVAVNVPKFVAGSDDNKKTAAAIALLEIMTPTAKVTKENSQNWSDNAKVLGSNEPTTIVTKATQRHTTSPKLLREIIQNCLPTPKTYAQLQESLGIGRGIRATLFDDNALYLSGFSTKELAEKAAAFIKAMGIDNEASIVKPKPGEPFIAKFFQLSQEQISFFSQTFVQYSKIDLLKMVTWAKENPEWSNPKSDEYLSQLKTLKRVMEDREIKIAETQDRPPVKATKTVQPNAHKFEAAASPRAGRV